MGNVGRYEMRSRFDITLTRGDGIWQLDSTARTIMNFASGIQTARFITGYTSAEYTDNIHHIRLFINDGGLTFSGLSYSLEGLRPSA